MEEADGDLRTILHQGERTPGLRDPQMCSPGTGMSGANPGGAGLAPRLSRYHSGPESP